MALADRPAWMTDLPPQRRRRHSVWWWVWRVFCAIIVIKAVLLLGLYLVFGVILD